MRFTAAVAFLSAMTGIKKARSTTCNSPLSHVHAINAGGNAVSEGGVNYIADTNVNYFLNGDKSGSGGLYQTHRTPPAMPFPWILKYELPGMTVGSTYRITFKFAEDMPPVMACVFDINVESTTAHSAVDVFALAGGANIPIDLESVYTATDDTLQVDFIWVSGGFPFVNAIVVEECSPPSPTTGSPSKAPTGSPTKGPTKGPTTSPTTQPSSQPSSSPSGQPSGSPSETPSGQPSSSPSEQPSGIPSTAPSSQPSSSPSEHPSTTPSQHPTSQPSGQPSAQPSCTPSTSPTDPATTFLFRPDWSPGSAGCINDGNEPNYMSNNPSAYMFSTLEACCRAYFNWNFAECSGNLPGICARSLFYPDWEGENVGCIADGNEPTYMTNNAMSYLFSQLEDCCGEHYSWNYDNCVGSFGTVYTTKYYPNWDGTDSGCATGGGQPQYMTNAPEIWMFDTLEECCTSHYNWNKDDCLGTSTTGSTNPAGTATGQFYPEWTGTDHICKEDGNQPAYMDNNPTTWLFTSLKACCAKHYSWNYDACIGSGSSSGGGSGTTGTATGKYYMSWSAGKCRQDCEAGTGICGGLAAQWDQLYDTIKECCAGKNWWEPDCISDSSS